MPVCPDREPLKILPGNLESVQVEMRAEIELEVFKVCGSETVEHLAAEGRRVERPVGQSDPESAEVLRLGDGFCLQHAKTD
jgi:hypothetical protein